MDSDEDKIEIFDEENSEFEDLPPETQEDQETIMQKKVDQIKNCFNELLEHSERKSLNFFILEYKSFNDFFNIIKF